MLCDIFLFKQKTAYEMRISDWSSDVCSSDLAMRLKDVGYSGQFAVPPEMLMVHHFQSFEVARRFLSDALKKVSNTPRSEERRVGKECVSTCRSRWSPYH